MSLRGSLLISLDKFASFGSQLYASLLLLCVSVWNYWIFSSSCYVFDCVDKFAPVRLACVLSSSEGLSHCYCWIFWCLFCLEGGRSVSFKIHQWFQEVTPPRKSDRVGCIGLRYLLALTFPACCCVDSLCVVEPFPCCPNYTNSIWSFRTEVNLIVREKIQCFQWVRK